MRINVNKDYKSIIIHEDTFCYEILFDFQSNDLGDTCELIICPWYNIVPKLEEIKELIAKFYALLLENSILYGFTWKDKSLFLTKDVANEIKLEYLTALLNPKLIISYTFKTGDLLVGETINTISTFEELQLLYNSMNLYINNIKLEIWNKQANIDYSIFEERLKELEEEVNPKYIIELLRMDKLNQLRLYDISGNVNGFYIGTSEAWIPKADRVGLANSTNILLSLGILTTTLWLDGNQFTIKCEVLLQMLAQLEIYALECYSVTERHRNNINALETAEEIEAYDFTEGYPKMLEFNIKDILN